MYHRRKISRSSFMSSSPAVASDEETTIDLVGVPIVTLPATAQPSTLVKYLPWAAAAGVAYWLVSKR